MDILKVILPFVNIMAFEIHWLRRASNELDAVFQFYSRFAGERVARRRIGMIVHCADLLETMPYLGKEDEEFTNIRRYRYLVVLTYKVYYFIEGDDVYIASIWDCRQGSGAFRLQ